MKTETCEQCNGEKIMHLEGYYECADCGYTWADGSKTIKPETKQILIKEQDKGFEITVEGLSDIEVVGLLTIFKSRIELQLLQQFGQKGVKE